MDVLEKLCENLCVCGVVASLETAKTSILETLNPFENTRKLGRVLIEGRDIDSIDVEGIYSSATQAGPAVTRKVLHLSSVNLVYVLKCSFQGKKDLLKTKLHVKRKGLLNPKVVEINWEGSALAQELNNDEEVNDLLWQSIGQLSARDIEVKTDEDTSKVRIHVRDDRQVFQGELPPFQMYEKIAEHIYTLADASKAVRPSPTKQPTVSRPKSETSGIKYCFKCGTDMPRDAAFCLKCGTKQD